MNRDPAVDISQTNLRSALMHHVQQLCAIHPRGAAEFRIDAAAYVMRLQTGLRTARQQQLMGPLTELSVMGCAAPTRSKSASN